MHDSHFLRLAGSLLLLCAFIAPDTAYAQYDVPSIDADVQVSFFGLVFDRLSNTFDTTATITNTSTQTLSGELSFVLPSITPTSVTLANASCLTPNGQPVLLDSFPTAGLAPGQNLPPLLLQFSNPAQIGFTYTHTVLAGNECATEIILHAFEDSRTLPDVNTVQQTLQEFAPGYCQATLPPNPMTLGQAMTSIQQKLDQVAGAGALESVLAANTQTNQEVLSAMALGATANKLGPATLVALLAAHQNDPANPAHLVNAAGAAELLGLPNEALALLDAADAIGGDFGSPMGINGNAVGLNNRGYALLLTGQFAQAQTALTSAVALEPYLAEAKKNLGIALLCQGNAPAAAQNFRAGMIRSPSQPNLAQIFDLSQGLTADLPPIPYPAVPALFPSYHNLWKQLSTDQGNQFNSYESQIAAVNQQINQSDIGFTTPLMTLERENDIVQDINRLSALQFTSQNAPLGDLWAAVTAAQTAETDFTVTTSNQLNVLEGQIEAVGISNAQRAALQTQCQTLVKEAHTQWLYDQAHLDSATRSFINVWYRDLTGLAENLSQPLLNQRESLEANVDLISEYQSIINEADGYYVLVGTYWQLCQAPEQTGSPDAQPPNPGNSPACPPTLTAAKLGVDLFDFLSVSFNCEQVDVTVSTGTGLFVKMGPFVQLTVNRSGTFTVFAGVKASLVATSISAKAGFYIQGNDTDFTAAGVKLSASAGVGPVKIDAPVGFQVALIGSAPSPPGLQ